MVRDPRQETQLKIMSITSDGQCGCGIPHLVDRNMAHVVDQIGSFLENPAAGCLLLNAPTW